MYQADSRADSCADSRAVRTAPHGWSRTGPFCPYGCPGEVTDRQHEEETMRPLLLLRNCIMLLLLAV